MTATHPCVQGASADEVQQKLYQTALRGSVADDVQGFATMYPSDYPDLLDISSTPNRLLHANLTSQVSAATAFFAVNAIYGLFHHCQPHVSTRVGGFWLLIV